MAGKTVAEKVEEEEEEEGRTVAAAGLFGTDLQKVVAAKRGLGLLILYANLTRPTFGMTESLLSSESISSHQEFRKPRCNAKNIHRRSGASIAIHKRSRASRMVIRFLSRVSSYYFMVLSVTYADLYPGEDRVWTQKKFVYKT
ncbi:hypothetical protein Tco_0275804 [Tanacetum coccineum]